eukprot:49175_1
MPISLRTPTKHPDKSRILTQNSRYTASSASMPTTCVGTNSSGQVTTLCTGKLSTPPSRKSPRSPVEFSPSDSQIMHSLIRQKKELEELEKQLSAVSNCYPGIAVQKN